MIIFFQILPFLAIFLLLFLLKKKAVYYFIPINIYFDAIVGFFPENTSFGILRAIALGMIILPHPKFIQNRIAMLIYVILFYWFFLVFISSNVSYSFKVYLQVFFTMIFFPIGASLSKSGFDFKHYSYSMLLASVLLVLNFILSNLLGIGENPYGEDLIYSGNLQTTSLYIISYVFLGFPFVVKSLKDNKIFKNLYLLNIFSLVIILLMFGRRSPIAAILLGIGVLFLFYYRKNLKKIIGPAFIALVFVTILGSVFFDKILKTYSARETRFEQGNYESELRYIETQFIWLEYLGMEDPTESLFGKEIFNTIGNYANGMFGDRPIHVDFNRVLHGSGFVGLFLYLTLLVSFLVKCLQNIWRALKVNNLLNSTPFPSNLLTAYALLIFITMLFFSFSGGLSGVTFRSYIFFMLGFTLNVNLFSNNNESNQSSLSV